MRELLFVGILVALSLVMQIFFLRVSKEFLDLKPDEPRFKRMVNLIYLNLGFYIVLVIMLFISILQR